MSSISNKRKIISCILKLIVVIGAVVGVIMSGTAGRAFFMGGSRVFMYFTIQSNILIAMICGAGLLFLLQGRTTGTAWYTLKLVGTVSITLTGVVFAVLLAPLLGKAAWNVQNTLTHAVVPAAAVADFFVSAGGVRLRKLNAAFVIIPPLMYVIYAGIGYVLEWDFAMGQNYPYFFLNWGSPAGALGIIDEFPYIGCVWWILILLAFLIGVALLYLAIAERSGERRN